MLETSSDAHRQELIDEVTACLQDHTLDPRQMLGVSRVPSLFEAVARALLSVMCDVTVHLKLEAQVWRLVLFGADDVLSYIGVLSVH